MAWICAECREAECLMNPEAEQLLVCEGPCIRVFHYPCAGLLQMPGQDETYICKECTEMRHACSLCKEYGIDHKEVFKCSKQKCGLFFHEACLSMKNVEINVVPLANPASIPESPPSEGSKLIFTCPAHSCWTCTQWDLKKEEDDQAIEAAAPQKRGKSRGKKKKQSLPGFFSSKKEATLVVSFLKAFLRLLTFPRLKIYRSSTALPRMSNVVPHQLYSPVGEISRARNPLPRALRKREVA